MIFVVLFILFNLFILWTDLRCASIADEEMDRLDVCVKKFRIEEWFYPVIKNYVNRSSFLSMANASEFILTIDKIYLIIM